MNKAHLTILALLIAGATVLGAIAVTRTTNLGRAAQHTNDAAFTARAKQLSVYAAKLQKELRAKPPALPPIPKPNPAPAPVAAPAPAAPVAAAAPTIVYHRPPPVVTVIHTRHHGDDGRSEGGGGGGGDD